MSRNIAIAFGILISLLLAVILAVRWVVPMSSVRSAPVVGESFVAAATTTQARSITVVGQGKASAQPDVVRAQVGVEVIAPTVQEAMRESNSRMTAVLAKLQELGVAEKDIQTSNYSISPERSYERGPGEVTGYRVSNMVQVTIRQLDQVGAILDRVVAAGANNIYGVSFTLDDPRPLEGEARAKAMADAEAKAQELAKLGGVSLGRVIAISEVVGGTSVPVARAALEMGGGGGPIAAGELEITVQIQVTYEIQ
jgi:uncharacterized protein YggE